MAIEVTDAEVAEFSKRINEDFEKAIETCREDGESEGKDWALYWGSVADIKRIVSGDSDASEILQVSDYSNYSNSVPSLRGGEYTRGEEEAYNESFREAVMFVWEKVKDKAPEEGQ